MIPRLTSPALLSLVLFHDPVLWGSSGGQVEAQELTGATRLRVPGPGPGRPLSSDSIHPGHDGQLVSMRHYAALTTTLDAANTDVVWQRRWTAAVVISSEIVEGQMGGFYSQANLRIEITLLIVLRVLINIT